MLDLRTHVDGQSMFNTPPVFSIFVMNETLKWLKGIGGVEAIQKINKEKAALLYSEIDRNTVFKGTAAVEDRSLMNAPFVTGNEEKLMEEEGMKTTPNKLIHIGNPIQFDTDLFQKQLGELMLAAYENTEKITDMVKEMVPTYKAGN